MNLLDEVFQIDEVISEGDTPVESFEWVLGKVLCLNVTIHADIIKDILAQPTNPVECVQSLTQNCC